MKKTEQKSLRLSLYDLKIVEDLKTKKECNFTEAIEYIISEYNKKQNNDNSINRFIQKLDKKIKNINPSVSGELIFENPEILDELNEIGSNIRMVLNALMIIGSADSNWV